MARPLAIVGAGRRIGVLTAASIVSAGRDTSGRSVVIGTAGEPERELAYGQVLVAAGDVTGGPQFVYVAMAEGLRLAAQAFSRDGSRLSCCAA